MLTFDVDQNGTLTSRIPSEIRFRDEDGIRPVAPFFELHGVWTEKDGQERSGPLTEDLLAKWGGGLIDVTWTVELANLKAYHYTRNPGDRVEARMQVSGGNYGREPLLGISPAEPEPLIRAALPLPMGEIQAPRPNPQHPEIRLRFYPPQGRIYGPENFAERIEEIDYDLDVLGDKPNEEWRGFELPKANLIVNPQATWPHFVSSASTLGPFRGADYRNSPSGLLAAPVTKIPWLNEEVRPRALGLVDDVSDGIVSCRVQLGAQTFEAIARIVVGPPDFAPANRPPISLADNLADREDRAGAREDVTAWSDEELSEIVTDIFERAFETSDLMHRDYQNLRSARENTIVLGELGARAQVDEEDLPGLLWPMPNEAQVRAGAADAMEISKAGTRQHRRHAATAFLEDRMRENPALFQTWVRRPLDPNPFFDKRMPALMRGSDGRPLHLTRRQWEIVREWIRRLQANTNAAGARPQG
ncbi:hypothetical protein [Pseudomonas sp. NPDC087336]|uniref:hypothetical protein n=1 Tax=Pseudomonas sp. NPDC087336 TaxID=3364436 RepID=UPI00382FAE10